MSIQAMESLLDYSHGFQKEDFQKMQERLRDAIEDEDAWYLFRYDLVDNPPFCIRASSTDQRYLHYGRLRASHPDCATFFV